MDGWLVGWLASWLVGCLVGWLLGWLVVGWLWLLLLWLVVGGCGCGCGCCCGCCCWLLWLLLLVVVVGCGCCCGCWLVVVVVVGWCCWLLLFLPSFLAPSFHQKTGKNPKKKRENIPKKNSPPFFVHPTSSSNLWDDWHKLSGSKVPYWIIFILHGRHLFIWIPQVRRSTKTECVRCRVRLKIGHPTIEIGRW